MAVGASGVSGLFWTTPITPGNQTAWLTAGVLEDGGVPIGGVSIDGTVVGGTPGSVLFVDLSGNLGQNNANFFWDVTNKRLGIGNSAPGAVLHSTITNASVSDSNTVGRIMEHLSTGSVTDLFGVLDQIILQDNGGVHVVSHEWLYRWDTSTTGSTYSETFFNQRLNGSLVTALHIGFDASLSWKPKQVQTNSRNIVDTDMPICIENTGAGTYNLQALNFATSGKAATIFVANVAGVTVNAPASQVIQMGPGAVTSSGGNITSTTVGSAVRLIGRQTGDYYAESIVGTWVTH